MLDLNNLKTSDFYYNLPEELIAQTPVEPRNASRMLVVDKQTGDLKHEHFYDLLKHLKKGDLLVLNDSRVLPARIYGKREDTGSFIEFLLLVQKSHDTWEILCRPGKKAKVGRRFVFGDDNYKLTAEVIEVKDDGNRIVKFEWDNSDNFFSILDHIGQMPLPPYIKEKLADKERYQTVYSHEVGSSAAPTAGLHFTTQMLEEIKQMGVDIAYVTLHVGLGTFRPVKADKVTEHTMHSEFYSVSRETADKINNTKKAGGRVITVGTTCVRTLESVYQKHGAIVPCGESTNIFIYPGYKFNVPDALITNFHLPESTLIMLVSAFLGYDFTMNAYKTAVEEKYRFFSFGDCMFIE